MRSAAFFLAICLALPAWADDTKSRARLGKFDARASVPCAQEQGEALGTCEVGVARGDGGRATVAAKFANGFVRLLFFEDGAFLRADTTMSGTGTDMEWAVVDGVYSIRVDDQRFELPEAFVLGE